MIGRNNHQKCKAARLGMVLLALFLIFFIVLFLKLLNSKTSVNSDCEIILSCDTYTVYVGDEVQISYTLIPDDSNVPLFWDAIDDKILDVSADGIVHANCAGETKVIASIGTSMATCTVTVLERSKYEQLGPAEKEFVDALLTVLDEFRNPKTVTINAIRARNDGTGWNMEVTAQNGFGGYNIESYYISENYIRKKLKNDVIHDDTYNLQDINQVIKDKQD